MAPDEPTESGRAFFFGLLPIPPEQAIAMKWEEWEEKRYSHEQRVAKAEEIKAVYDALFTFGLVIGIIGAELDWFSPGLSSGSLEIPEDLAEYVFLEDGKGRSLKCSKAILPMFNTVNLFNKQATVLLFFPPRWPDTNEPVFESEDEIRIILGGLGLEHKVFHYHTPFSKLFEDAPHELKSIYFDAGLWRIESQKARDENEYLTHLLIRNVEVSRANVDDATVCGEIKNLGDKTITSAKIVIYCLNANGQPIFEKRYDVVQTSRSSPSGYYPLKPNYARKFKVGMHDAPSEWVDRVEVKLIAAELEK